MLDFDPTFGRLREPLLKVTHCPTFRHMHQGAILKHHYRLLLQVLHVLRALEYKAHDERVLVLREMNNRIGQEPFASPSVFNFYLPEYQPHGR